MYYLLFLITLSCNLFASSYLPLTGIKDAERLTILNEVYNPATIAFLKEMGISPGMHVLDVGSGIGLISAEIAELVGPQGHVTCLDSSDEQLEIGKLVANARGLDNLSFVQKSAFEMQTLENSFDCIYIRFLLMHVQNPEKILLNAYNLLKPSGKVIIEEPTGLDPIMCYPMTQSFQDYLTIGRAQFKLYNTDCAIGSRLPQLLSQLNFKNFSTKLFHPILQTAREKKLIRFAVNTLTPAMVKSGLYSEEAMKQMSENLREIEEHPFYFVTYFELAQVCAER